MRDEDKRGTRLNIIAEKVKPLQNCQKNPKKIEIPIKLKINSSKILKTNRCSLTRWNSLIIQQNKFF